MTEPTLTDEELDDFDNLQPSQSTTNTKEAAQKQEPSFDWLDDNLRTIAERDDGEEWLTKSPPLREYLLSVTEGGKGPRGVLASGRVAFLASPGGVGKSHALCQLALAVSVANERATKWLDTFNVDRGGRVLLVMGEEESEEIRRRLYDAANVMGINDEKQIKEAIGNIVAMGLAGRTDIALAKTDGTDSKFAAMLRHKLEQHEWACIILDPLARFAGADVEKDNGAATRMVQVLEKLTHLPGKPTVIVAHHTRKQGNSDINDKQSADDMRGASGLRDGARFVSMLEDLDRFDNAPRLVRFHVVKNNYGTHPNPVLLTRDEDGGGALRRARTSEIDEYEKAKDLDASKRKGPPKDKTKPDAKGVADKPARATTSIEDRKDL